MMASTSSIELTFLLGSSPLPVDRKLRAQFFILEESAGNTYTVNPFFQALLMERGGGGGLIKSRVLNIAKSINGSKVSRGGRTCGSRALYCLFLTIRKSG